MKKIFFVILICILIIIIFLNSTCLEKFEDKEKEEQLLNFKKIVIIPTYPVYNTKLIASFSKNSLYYNYADVLGKIYPIQNKEGLGSVDNVRNLLKKKVGFAISQEDVVLDAVLGKGDFKKKNKNLSLVSAIFEEKICLIYNPNSGIKTWKDLKGKNVCFGSEGSGSLYVALEMCKLIDINLSDLNIVYDSIYSKNVLDLLIENKLDAISVTTSHPNKKLMNIFNIKLLLMIGTKGIPNISIQTRFPTWNNSDIDLTNYNVPSLELKIDTFAVKTVIVTLNNQEQSTVYKLANSIFSNTLYIRNNIKDKEDRLVLESYPISRSFPKHNVIKIHPAVLQYYKDIGMITQNKNPKCVLFAGSGECNLGILNYYTGY